MPPRGQRCLRQIRSTVTSLTPSSSAIARKDIPASRCAGARRCQDQRPRKLSVKSVTKVSANACVGSRTERNVELSQEKSEVSLLADPTD